MNRCITYLLVACASFLTACSEDEGCIDLLLATSVAEQALPEQEVEYESSYEDGRTVVRMEWHHEGLRPEEVMFELSVPSSPVAPCGPYTMHSPDYRFYQVYDGRNRLVFEGGQVPGYDPHVFSGEYQARMGAVCRTPDGADVDPLRSDIVEYNGQAVQPGESIAVEVDGRDYRLYNLGTNGWVALIPGEWAATCE